MQSPIEKSSNKNKSETEEKIENINKEYELSRSSTVNGAQITEQVKPPIPARRWHHDRSSSSRVTISKSDFIRDSWVKPQLPPRPSKRQFQRRQQELNLSSQDDKTNDTNADRVVVRSVTQNKKFLEAAKKISQALNSSTAILPNSKKITNLNSERPDINNTISKKDNDPEHLWETSSVNQNQTEESAQHNVSTNYDELHHSKTELERKQLISADKDVGAINFKIESATNDSLKNGNFAETDAFPPKNKFLEVALRISESLKKFGGNENMPDIRYSMASDTEIVQQNPPIKTPTDADDAKVQFSGHDAAKNFSNANDFIENSIKNLAALEEPPKFVRINMNEILNYQENDQSQEETQGHVAKEQDHVKTIINEFITAEETYIDVLEKITQQYKPYLNKNASNAKSFGKLCILFGNLEDLCKESKGFLTILNKKPDAGGVVTAFTQSMQMLEEYRMYVRNRPSVEMYYKWFEEISKHIEGDDSVDLASYLLTPIQRLIKYIRFLEKVEEALNSNNEYSCHITSTIETIKREMKDTNDLLALDSIENIPVKLASPGCFIMQESFEMIKPKRKKVVVFLFTNIIILASITENSEHFKYFGSILLQDLRVPPLAKKPEYLCLDDYNMNKAGAKSHSYTLKARDFKLKELWMEILANVLWEQLEHAKQALSPQIGAWEKRKGYTETAVAYIKKLRPVNCMMEAETNKIAILKAKRKE